ncbi:hypothetical protein PLIIFM63780_004980 [Purpureocillium lilacinum]|nr:hypothetical protein PLIIFM63780_004980 [Purpureocillium lilacinum]
MDRDGGGGGGDDGAPQASQASSHFPLDPVPASVLAAGELARRNAARALGPCGVGCAEVDDEALLGAGGLERGSVVGVSCEDEDGFGLTVVVRMLLAHETETALVVTPRPAGVVLRALRDGIGAELRARREAAAAVSGGAEGVDVAQGEDAAAVRACLDRVMLSCVFDVDGLWEVLAELDRPAETATPPPESPGTGRGGDMEEQRRQEVGIGEDDKTKASPPPSLEIQDSEDEGLTPSPAPAVPRPEASTGTGQEAGARGPTAATTAATALGAGADGPSIVLVTHFSTLLTSLFAHREKSAAHSSLQLLASQARYLSRSLLSQPLFMLLNSTSSSAHDGRHEPGTGSAAPASGDGPGGAAVTTRALDPTLRSVFNPPTIPLPAYRAPRAATRRNKPSFGLIFSQMLDTHLLCTPMPRTRADADVVYGGGSNTGNGDDRPDNQQHHQQQAGSSSVEYVTVVEVLLDEMGLWQGRTGPRPNREQRWGVVDVVGGRVVDAFVRTERAYAEIRTSGGFGGRRP